MDKVIHSAAWLVCTGKRIYARKWPFLGLFAFVFLGSVSVLVRLDLLPSSSVSSNAKAMENKESTVGVTIAVQDIPELPTKIVIPVINLSSDIANPTTTDAEILDQELLSGAVRYPTSAKLGEIGNVVLFGHSSYLPIVNNQAYKTFNGIQKLTEGDTVIVYSSDTAYTYRVKSVTKESINDATITLSVTEKVLTLSTCDSFNAKTDRFVVVADFVESHAIPQ